ncbi:hypothetical protein [Rhizobium sp. 11_C7_N12_5]|uniref:hypothetical protein n=1 Tax=Rhizobium sp. 11_C7_N12_5 TaxID=3240770 RepID=UPI003F1E6B15
MAALPLEQVFDFLPIASVDWNIQRNDELSGAGSGDMWTAELSDPLWVGEVTLGVGRNDELKQAAARIRSLRGTQVAFMMCDPISQYPQADPKGSILGNAVVTLRTIGPDRITARMKGFPPGYVLTVGDKLQINYLDLAAFVEVGATGAADAAGNLDVPIYPNLPSSFTADSLVVVKRPACPVIIEPESHKAGTATRDVTDGAGFKVLQKRRS